MATRNKPVTTPLHLLQQLSHSLLEHLEQACSQALVDAEKLLAKLEKQRSKAQDKLHKASARLEEAAAAGKAKAQAKARESIAELEELLDTLRQRQGETRDYIVRLKADAEQSLHLAQGIGKVKESVASLLARREAGEAEAQAVTKPRAPRRPRVAAAPAVAPIPA
ncbi:AlgP family protein, partial [Pseudomonas sp. A-1]|uniref:AlgP family protein n=1 Tax=Pseudomonas sp. A-1 TaxID=1821274 RepID=UPI001C49820B